MKRGGVRVKTIREERGMRGRWRENKGESSGRWKRESTKQRTKIAETIDGVTDMAEATLDQVSTGPLNNNCSV